MIKIIITASILLLTMITSGQNSEGYWDKERTTTKEVILGAGSKTWIRTDEFPTGTTEIVYRITLLDEDQKIIDGLATVLSLIPDPSGISKGTAGTMGLMSKMSGSDKCYYSIFSSYNDANDYFNTGNYQTACYSNPNEINKDVNRISIYNNKCLKEGTKYLWFGFKNTNMLQSEKIILEVVPWVNNNASRGWTKTIKTTVMDNCKKQISSNNFKNPDEYCLCLIEKLENKFSLQDYQKLITAEQNKVFKIIGKECLVETGEINKIYDVERQNASSFINSKEYYLAINKYLEVISNAFPTITDYNNLGYCYILTKQYLKAIKFLKEGEKLDETDLLIKGNLAHAYMLNGDFDDAKKIYVKYKNQNIDENTSWKKMVNDDFEQFSNAGIVCDKFDEIIEILK